jgi:hypothetical protein
LAGGDGEGGARPVGATPLPLGDTEGGGIAAGKLLGELLAVGYTAH